MLSREQRQLLGVYPATMISDTIVDPERGIKQIASSQCGGTRDGPVPSFNTGGGRIYAGWLGQEPTVVVTFAQLKRWAESVPSGLREQIRAVRLAEQTEAVRTLKWCHCPNPERCLRSNQGDPLYGGRHHPTDEEYEQHLEIVFGLRDQERALLDEALGLVDNPVGQLDLFGELIGGTA